MKLINMTCPNCGSQLQVDTDYKQAKCEFCGNVLLIDDGVQHIQYDNAENAGYEFEKGRQRAQKENAAYQLGRQVGQRAAQTGKGGYWQNQPKKKSNSIWLWVIGWIFIFPIPLTILVLRSSKLNKDWKIGLVAGAWVFYLFIALIGNLGKNTNTNNSTNNTRQTNDKTITSDNNDSTETESSSGNITEIKFTYDELKIMEGKSNSNSNVQVKVNDRKAFSPEDIEFVSENPEIATIEFDRDALTTYIYYSLSGITPGETYVYAKAKDGSIESDHIKVIVEDDGLIDPESISIQNDISELALGESMALTVNTVPENATIKEISWSSSDNNVITVDANGRVLAVGGGTATITGTISDDIKASCELSVDDTKRTMSVKVTRKRDDDNNIGDEWSFSNSVNGETSVSSITLSAGDTVSIYSKYSEDDDNPDVGEASSSYTVTEEDLQNGFDIVMDLYVTENGGRNSGKSAHFVVTYSFSVK